MRDWLRGVSGRVTYALVLWVLAFSALEQFGDLNKDLNGVRPAVFHVVAGVLALGVALFESVTLRGLSGLRHLWERPDPIESFADRKCEFRAARPVDLQKVRKLAIKRYGWAFPLESLRRWYRCNPNCLFLMLSESAVVGYVDAFPISDADYRFLLAGGEERLMTPLTEREVDSTTSFYIASLVVDVGWGFKLPTLLKKALTFYSSAYPNKPWTRLCAIGYSAAGQSLLQAKEMRVVPSSLDTVDMYTVEANQVGNMKEASRRFWQKLFP